jgi:hypothetical protein
MKGMRLDNTATFPIFKYLQIFSFSDGTIETFFFEGQKTNRPIIWEFERI